MAEGKFVSYLRVSTIKQGRSGLGLEAQRAAVETFLDGGRWKIIEEFVETKSGKRDDRPAVCTERSGRTGDEVRRGSGVISSYRQAEPVDVQARLCQGTDEFGLRYSSSRRRAAYGADAPRHRQ